MSERIRGSYDDVLYKSMYTLLTLLLQTHAVYVDSAIMSRLNTDALCCLMTAKLRSRIVFRLRCRKVCEEWQYCYYQYHKDEQN